VKERLSLGSPSNNGCILFEYSWGHELFIRKTIGCLTTNRGIKLTTEKLKSIKCQYDSYKQLKQTGGVTGDIIKKKYKCKLDEYKHVLVVRIVTDNGMVILSIPSEIKVLEDVHYVLHGEELRMLLEYIAKIK
jgi:hypothetical protein